jgi:hypothetical protein
VETASKGSGTRAADEGGAVTWGGTLGAGATAGREGAVVRGGEAQRGWWRGGAKRGRAREWNGHTQGETREEGNKKEGAVLNPSYIHRLTTNTRRLHHVCRHVYIIPHLSIQCYGPLLFAEAAGNMLAMWTL